MHTENRYIFMKKWEEKDEKNKSFKESFGNGS